MSPEPLLPPVPAPGPGPAAPRAPGFAPAGDARAAYETHGTSLVRYLARRTAKTRLLLQLAEALPGDAPPDDAARLRNPGHPDTPARPADPARALAVFGAFCAAAAASFGRGYRQPSFDATGTEITDADPETGARIVARLDGRGPGSRLRLSVAAELPGIARFAGREEIVGTTVGIHGLGMPAPSVFEIASLEPLAPWSARAVGTITAELAPRLAGTLVRGHGVLELEDDRGTRGTVTLERSGRIVSRARAAAGMHPGEREVVIEQSLAG